jgi:hypothetical protein
MKLMLQSTSLNLALLSVFAFSSVSSPAFASSYTGRILSINTQASPFTQGNVRVAVEVPAGTTSCGNNYLYVYDLPAGPLATMWGAQLLAAYVNGRSVTITGNGTCDQYAVEGISVVYSQ